VATLEGVEQYWSLDDVLRAVEVLDALAVSGSAAGKS
jgi:hypothetical protein